ncbi:MAG: hypothetical protein M1820_008666 [Bogoriella megaspora]|nr:MAG: hypothetical protein M1820_008666 [Bogoriella megaspora]
MDDEGGFVKSLTSPPLSSAGSSTITPSLPHPRNHSLAVGSPKEASFVRFVNQYIDRIQHHYANRDNEEEQLSKRTGYRSFKEFVAEAEKLVDLIWVSGTPSLQITFLLNVALLVQTYIPNLPPAPKAMFRLLDKLDTAFASLLQGRDLDSGEMLPGFETGRGVSGTEKVRIKSIADNTRVVVVHLMSQDHLDFQSETDSIDENDASMEEDEMKMDPIVEPDFAMNTARVYDKTIVELGDQLGAINSV